MAEKQIKVNDLINNFSKIIHTDDTSNKRLEVNVKILETGSPLTSYQIFIGAVFIKETTDIREALYDYNQIKVV